MTFKKLIPLSILFFQLGFIKPAEVQMGSAIPTQRWVTLSKQEVLKKVASTQDPLSRAAAYQFLNQYEDCAKSAKRVPAKSIVFDYALKLELVCAKKALETKNNLALAEIYLQHLLKYEKQINPKIKDQLREYQINYCQQLAKKSMWKQLKANLQKVFDQEFEFTKSQRAIAMGLTGDLMIFERKWIDASTYFYRAKDLDGGIDLESKIKNVLSLLPATLKDKIESARLKTAPSPTPGGDIIPSPDEMDFYNQANTYLSKGDVVSATEAMVGLLKKFPVSAKSKWAQDKIYDLLSQEVDKSRGPDGSSVAKNKIIKLILDVDVENISDWGRNLFNSQDYIDAAILFDKAYELTENSQRGSKNLYMAARSYQLATQYSDAKSLYKKFTSKYPAASEFVDAAIQWGLVDYNGGDYAEAITHFEMARSRRMTYQQDLISLFWLFQSYKTKGEINLKIKSATELIARFPLTYYGLIAYNELNQALPTFIKPKPKKLKLIFSQAESKALERAKALMKAGLLEEASDEIAQIQTRDLSTDESIYLSENYAKVLDYPKVFGLLSSVFDQSPNLKDEFLLKTQFPQEFWSQVSDNNKRFELDPYLLLSVMRQESAFRPQAVSRSGALGLLQMIPPTAEEVKAELNVKINIPDDMFDVGTNIKFCAYYLAKLIKKYDGSVPLALAAYNAGPTRISQFIKAQGGQVKDTWVDELPLSETSFYVKSILKNYVYYKILYAGQTKLGTPPWAVQ